MKKPSAKGGLSSEADGTRTRNHRIDRHQSESHNDLKDKDLQHGASVGATDRATDGGTKAPADDCDEGLRRVADAWDRLPEAIRVAILAMVNAVARKPSSSGDTEANAPG